MKSGSSEIPIIDKPPIGSPMEELKDGLDERKIKCEYCNFSVFTKKYFTKYYELVGEIEKLLICPISLEMVKEPVITPSGNLIDGSIAAKLINERKNDPFNGDLPMITLVFNRFAAEIKKLILKIS